MTRHLTRLEARAVYDRIGRWQDTQRFYEAPALAALKRGAGFDTASRVLEFGCGTGRFARQLLCEVLSPTAQYVGTDVSPRMVAIARERLGPWADRAEVRLTDGSPIMPDPAGAYDRFVATYVVELLSPEDAANLLSEAARVLTSDGRLCLVSLTHGETPLAQVVGWGWQQLYALRPRLLGGCRPIRLPDLLSATDWAVRHHQTLTAFNMSPEIVVAIPIPAPATPAPLPRFP